ANGYANRATAHLQLGQSKEALGDRRSSVNLRSQLKALMAAAYPLRHELALIGEMKLLAELYSGEGDLDAAQFALDRAVDLAAGIHRRSVAGSRVVDSFLLPETLQ